MITREELIDQLLEYRERVKDLMLKSTDPLRVNLMGIRYESSTRIINELLKAIFEEDKIGKLEAEIV